jgi:hypothetical protein
MHKVLPMSFPDTIGHALTVAAGALGAAITAKFAVEKAFGWTYDGFKDRRRVRVTMHRAVFVASQQEAYFITVTNLSRSREVELSHVWIASRPKVFAHRTDRPLPRRLKSDEAWETWVFLDELPPLAEGRVLHLGRVRLSTGTVLKSRPNPSVPESGHVPGGPVERLT